MTRPPTLTIDGETCGFEPGETLLDVAQRAGREIPTLCHDPRLEPAGACRTCLVEVEGRPRLVPSCATKAAAGLQVQTKSPRVERHRRALFALYLSDNVGEAALEDSAAPSELHRWAREVGAPTDWPRMAPLRRGRPDDRNPWISFREGRCILCAQCTRYCEEVEGVSAITLTGRGPETTISTVDQISLLDSSCELCGGCIDVCPTGAMTERNPLERGAPPEASLKKIRTTCNYCGVGCQLDLNIDRAAHEGRGRVVKVTSPPAGTPPNDGNLCVKGRFVTRFIDHPDRLTHPLVRDAAGRLVEASWDDALERATRGLLRVRGQHGPGSLGFVSSSRCTVEENYLVQKLARAAFGTHNVHQCAAT